MSKFTVSVIGALVVFLLILLALQGRRQQAMAEQLDATRAQLEQLAQENEQLSNALSEARSPQVAAGDQSTDLSQLRADLLALRDELSSFKQARTAAAQEEINHSNMMVQRYLRWRTNASRLSGPKPQ